MRSVFILTGALAVLGLSAPPAYADVELTMRDGRVTLIATNATVRDILQAWSRIGSTTIINAERVTSGPITLHLTNVPEAEALAVILRPVSGYIAAPRREEAAHLSQFDRIHVLPTSTAPKVAPSPASAFPQPQFPPQFNPFNQQGEPVEVPVDPGIPVADPNNPNQVPPFVPPPRGPIFGAFPPPVQVQPQQPSQPATEATPPFYRPGGASVGVSVPGMMPPAPEPRPGVPVPGGIIPPPNPDPR